MTTIHVLHRSLLGFKVSHYIKHYLQQHHIANDKVLTKSYVSRKDKGHTYFIIKSPLLTSELMHTYLRDIRYQSDLAKIIIIGNHINYEELFKNHYRVFGVIDTTNNKSLDFIKKELTFYLDGLCGKSSSSKPSETKNSRNKSKR